MTENKQFHLKIKWKNKEKTESYEIVLYDGGQPLCELISVDDARLVRDVLNEQDKTIKKLEKDVDYWKQVASQYSNELNVFEHCKKHKTECKDIYWDSD